MFASISVALKHESTSEAVVHAVRYCSGYISLVNGGELAVSLEPIDNASFVNTVFHVFEDVAGVLSED